MTPILMALLLGVVNSTYTPAVSACNGVTATFSVPWSYDSQTYLVVTSTTAGGSVTTLALSTDYTLNLISTSTTATLTLTNPAVSCPTGNTLKIARSTPQTQPTSLGGQTQYLPQTVMQMMDRTVREVQEITPNTSQNVTSGAFGNQGSTTTVLHGNASGPLAFSKVVDADVTPAYSGTGSCAAHTWSSTLNRAIAPTCTQPAPVDLSGAAADSVIVGNGAPAWVVSTVPDCHGSTQFLKYSVASHSFTCEGASAGGTVRNTSFSIVDRVLVGKSAQPTNVAGNDTTGITYQITAPLTIIGVKFAWNRAAAATIRAKAYDAAGTLRGSVDVSTSGVGTYTGTFGSPYTFLSADLNADLIVSIYELSGSFYQSSAVGVDSARPTLPFMPGVNWLWPWASSQTGSFFTAGDAKPTTHPATENYWFMEPVFSNN